MSLVTSLNWRLKLLIAGATLIAAAVTLAVAEAGSTQIWSGRTTVTIGMAPSLSYLLLSAYDPNVSPIEAPRHLAARISDPGFRAEVLNQAKFEGPTAARSRSLAASTMRGIGLVGEREIAIELSAASPADVEAVFRALGHQIDKVHNAILENRKRFLQEKMARDRIRMESEKSRDELNSLLFPSRGRPDDRLEGDMVLGQLSGPSVMHLEPGTFIQGKRNVATFTASLLAGFVMLVAMAALTFAINFRTQPPTCR
jgi:hypothetical protein